jgi:hypothetical protein
MSTNHLLACAAGALAFILTIPAVSSAQNGPRGKNPSCCLLPVVTEPVTANEAKSLTFMREEEKLARDVYRQMFKKWNLRIFENIAKREQNHFEAIGALLARYNVPDPAATTAEGVFANPTLSALYNELMAKGAASLKDALEDGLVIEKQDVADLQAAMPGIVKSDIKQVYANLLSGSLNHQEAFEQAHEVCIAAP